MAKKMEENKKKEKDEKNLEVVRVEPKDEIILETIEEELCEKVFVIPRHKVDNHNIGIEFDVTEKLESKGIKVKNARVERTGGILRGDFDRCVVSIEPTNVKLIENVNFGILNCCVLPYS